MLVWSPYFACIMIFLCSKLLQNLFFYYYLFCNFVALSSRRGFQFLSYTAAASGADWLVTVTFIHHTFSDVKTKLS